MRAPAGELADLGTLEARGAELLLTGDDIAKAMAQVGPVTPHGLFPPQMRCTPLLGHATRPGSATLRLPSYRTLLP
jgi:hypothetical protein